MLSIKSSIWPVSQACGDRTGGTLTLDSVFGLQLMSVCRQDHVYCLVEIQWSISYVSSHTPVYALHGHTHIPYT